MHNGEMTAQDAAELIDLIESVGIEVYVDGGWGVDALLGRQTRPHLDLDIALPYRDLPLLRRLLIVAGFVQIPTADTWQHNFVVQDDRLRRIDVHTYILDRDGNNIGGVAYYGHHLAGRGMIGNRKVRCIPVDTMIEFHLGYGADEDDFADVLALCQAFDRPLPAEYERFRCSIRP
jgi:lincosamide nucleotidyltransferase A/C/D/E